MRPGWNWRAHARQSPTYTDVCKVIRRPPLPSCGQLGRHDDTTADNLTVFEHCKRRTQKRAVGPRTLPRVWSDNTSRILPRAPPFQHVHSSTSCWRSASPRRGPERVQPRGCSATQRPFPELWATPPEVPPRWFGRTSPAPPPFQSCSPGRGELLPCSSARKGGARGGAAAALGCDPGGFTSGSRFAGAGRGGLGWGGQGRYLRAGGVWRSGPLGVTRPTPSGSYLPPLGSIPLSPDLLRVRSGHHPVEAADPREAPGGVGGWRGEL